jgi:hypothetical protein
MIASEGAQLSPEIGVAIASTDRQRPPASDPLALLKTFGCSKSSAGHHRQAAIHTHSWLQCYLAGVVGTPDEVRDVEV